MCKDKKRKVNKMSKKIFIMVTSLLILSLIVVGCSPSDASTELKAAEEKIETLNQNYSELEKEKEELEKRLENIEKSNSSGNVISFSLDIMEMIKNNDMNALSTHVHPSKGLRFTPYTYVDIQNNRLFTAAEVAGLNQDNTVYNWGDYDGSGFPIDLTFSDYYNEFIYDADFLNPHMIGNNLAIGSGNMIENTSTAYPNGSFVEYHFTGFDPQYAGIDWGSLTLVFEQDNGDWYLVGIIHGQWTI